MNAQSPELPAAGQQIIPRPPDWKLGPARHWNQALPDALDVVLKTLADVDDIRDVVRGAGDAGDAHNVADLRASAVLVVIAPGARGPQLLLTRRSQQMSSHAGEVSFVGGRLDPGEDAITAARREAHEEVGLDPAAVTVHGQLDHVWTVGSNSHIVPVVATTSAAVDLRAQPEEVDRVLWVPIADLIAGDAYHSEIWDFDMPGLRDPDYELHFFELFDPYHETVWGVTARILVDLLTRLDNATSQ